VIIVFPKAPQRHAGGAFSVIWQKSLEQPIRLRFATEDGEDRLGGLPPRVRRDQLRIRVHILVDPRPDRLREGGCVAFVEERRMVLRHSKSTNRICQVGSYQMKQAMKRPHHGCFDIHTIPSYAKQNYKPAGLFSCPSRRIRVK